MKKLFLAFIVSLFIPTLILGSVTARHPIDNAIYIKGILIEDTSGVSPNGKTLSFNLAQGKMVWTAFSSSGGKPIYIDSSGTGAGATVVDSLTIKKGVGINVVLHTISGTDTITISSTLGSSVDSTEIVDSSFSATKAVKDHSIPLIKLSTSGASLDQFVKFNGTDWSYGNAPGGGSGNPIKVDTSDVTAPSDVDSLVILENTGAIITLNTVSGWDTLKIATTLGIAIDSLEITDGAISALDLSTPVRDSIRIGYRDSVTKAYRDASNNIIASTYLPMASFNDSLGNFAIVVDTQGGGLNPFTLSWPFVIRSNTNVDFVVLNNTVDTLVANVIGGNADRADTLGTDIYTSGNGDTLLATSNKIVIGDSVIVNGYLGTNGASGSGYIATDSIVIDSFLMLGTDGIKDITGYGIVAVSNSLLIDTNTIAVQADTGSNTYTKMKWPFYIKQSSNMNINRSGDTLVFAASVTGGSGNPIKVDTGNGTGNLVDSLVIKEGTNSTFTLVSATGYDTLTITSAAGGSGNGSADFDSASIASGKDSSILTGNSDIYFTVRKVSAEHTRITAGAQDTLEISAPVLILGQAGYTTIDSLLIGGDTLKDLVGYGLAQPNGEYSLRIDTAEIIAIADTGNNTTVSMTWPLLIKQSTNVNINKSGDTLIFSASVTGGAGNPMKIDTGDGTPILVDSLVIKENSNTTFDLVTASGYDTLKITSAAGGSGNGSADFDTTSTRDSSILTGNSDVYFSVRRVGAEHTRITAGAQDTLEISAPVLILGQAGYTNIDSLIFGGDTLKDLVGYGLAQPNGEYSLRIDTAEIIAIADTGNNTFVNMTWPLYIKQSSNMNINKAGDTLVFSASVTGGAGNPMKVDTGDGTPILVDSLVIKEGANSVLTLTSSAGYDTLVLASSGTGGTKRIKSGTTTLDDSLYIKPGSGITLSENVVVGMDTLTITSTLGIAIDSSEISNGSIIASDLKDSLVTGVKVSTTVWDSIRVGYAATSSGKKISVNGTVLGATDSVYFKNGTGVTMTGTAYSGYDTIVVDATLGTSVDSTETAAGLATLRNNSVDSLKVVVGSLPMSRLTDFSITTPDAGQLLSYNGVDWVNIPPTTLGGGGVVGYYPDDSIAPSGGVNLMESYPISRVEETDSVGVNGGASTTDTLLIDLYTAGSAIGTTTIEGGAWDFTTYGRVSATTGVSILIHRVGKVVAGAGTVAITGTGTSRTATVSGGTPFVTEDFSSNIITTSYLETPTATFKITGYTSSTVLTIETPTGYVNESGVVYSTNRYLFAASTSEINSTTTMLYETNTVQPAFTVLATDKLSVGYFAATTAGTTIYVKFTHNGTSNYSHIHTPLIRRHNELAGLQGGTSAQYYHLTSLQVDSVASFADGVTTNNLVNQTIAKIDIDTTSSFTVGRIFKITANIADSEYVTKRYVDLAAGQIATANLDTANSKDSTILTGATDVYFTVKKVGAEHTRITAGAQDTLEFVASVVILGSGGYASIDSLVLSADTVKDLTGYGLTQNTSFAIDIDTSVIVNKSWVRTKSSIDLSNVFQNTDAADKKNIYNGDTLVLVCDSAVAANDTDITVFEGTVYADFTADSLYLTYKTSDAVNSKIDSIYVTIRDVSDGLYIADSAVTHVAAYATDRLSATWTCLHLPFGGSNVTLSAGDAIAVKVVSVLPDAGDFVKIAKITVR